MAASVTVPRTVNELGGPVIPGNIFHPTPEQIPSNTEYKVFHFQIRIQMET